MSTSMFVRALARASMAAVRSSGRVSYAGSSILAMPQTLSISEADLREEITAAQNKAESYNGFSEWLRFGSDVIERNDPAEQEKIIKFNSLVANCVIFHTALDMTAVIRQLLEEGWVITQEDLASLSPYLTERIKRFG